MSNPYNNEVIFNGQTLMSLKEDTVTPDKVLAGETFHDRSGAPQTGNLITHNVYDGLDSTSTSDALSANQGRELNEKIEPIGTIAYGVNNASAVSVAADTSVAINSITITKGTWLMIACADWAPNGLGYRQISIEGAVINPNRSYATTTNGIDGKEVYQQVTRIITTFAGGTWTIYARQSSSNNLNVYPYCYAIYIGPFVEN